MIVLRQLQKDFQRYLLDRGGPVADYIVGTEKVDASVRLEIYADAYRLRLLEALETDFVALRAYVAQDAFEEIGLRYIDAHPSDHFSLRYFGRHMSRFLASTAPYCGNTLLSELAAFDWALADAFDAPDSPVVRVEDVAAVAPADWPALCFVPHASLIRLDLSWNAPAIWKAVDEKVETLPAPERSEHPVAWAIWRKELTTYFRSLGVDEAWSMDAMLCGETFGTICEGLCEWIDAKNVAAHAAGLLKGWVLEGMIKRIALAPK